MSVVEAPPLTAFKIPIWLDRERNVVVNPSREAIENWEVFPYYDPSAEPQDRCSITLQKFDENHHPYYFLGAQPNAQDLHGYSEAALRGCMDRRIEDDPECRVNWGRAGGQLRRIYALNTFDPEKPHEWVDVPPFIMADAALPAAHALTFMPAAFPDDRVERWLRLKLYDACLDDPLARGITHAVSAHVRQLLTDMAGSDGGVFTTLGLAHDGLADPLASMQRLLSSALWAMCFEMVMQPEHRFYVRIPYQDGHRLAEGTFQLQARGDNWVGFVFTREGPPAPENRFLGMVREIAHNTTPHLQACTQFVLVNLERLLLGRASGAIHRLARLPHRFGEPEPFVREMTLLVLTMLRDRAPHVRFHAQYPSPYILFPETGLFVQLTIHQGEIAFIPMSASVCTELELDGVTGYLHEVLAGWGPFETRHVDYLLRGKRPRYGPFWALVMPSRDINQEQALKRLALVLQHLLDIRRIVHVYNPQTHMLHITAYDTKPANDFIQLSQRADGYLGYSLAAAP
jgi:hypothetical protein